VRIRIKRSLFLVHRWVGVAVCVFMAMWFVSGVVMMYVGYPKLTEAERLARLPTLHGAGELLSPTQALAAAGVGTPVKDLRLSVASGARPVYLAEPDTKPTTGQRPAPRGRQTIVIDAQTGQRLDAVDEALALRSAQAFAGAEGTTGAAVAARYQGTVMEDAFTHSRALDGHRPLHIVQLDDAPGTRLYVSGRTGEVVRDASASERLWNYAGAWIHWLYPFRGNAFDRYWADIVNWLSVVCIVGVVTGTVVGLLRWRFAGRYRNGSQSPYARPMMRWHHLSGLLFAAVTLTWIFSGLMSMNPWRVFDANLAHPRDLLAAAGGDVRELRWTQVLGQPAVLARSAAGATQVLDARTAQPAPPSLQAVHAALPGLLNAPIVQIDTLNAYDLYYYPRDAHTMTGDRDKPLPILRVVFADDAKTWVHIDPATAAVVGRLDTGRRTSRWLFAMLHSWDWLPLLTRRPLWDVLLIALSVGGAVLSLTGVAIGWQRVRLQLRRPQAVTRP
jgi:uncharacterized iron-regulated membrane protein